MTSQTRRGRSGWFSELLPLMSACQTRLKQLKTRLNCSGVRLQTCDIDSSACGATCRRTFSTRRYCHLYAAITLVFVVVVAPAAGNAPPRFVMNGESEIVLRLKEGPQTPVGSVLYRLRGYDPDGDRLKFAVRGQVGSRLLEVIQVSDTEADVILKRPLDREMVDEYSIILTLTDGRLNDNFVTQSMLLLVDDVNDNRPIFLPHESTLVVSEDAAPQVLAVLEATDRDEGPFGQVVYRLYPPSVSDVFSVSTQDGQAVLRLSGSLDYERRPFYQLQVLAIDRAAQSPHTATAALLVNVDDAADTPVEFVFVPPVARIPEDTAVGSQVTRVLAIDGDRGVNAPTEYTLRGGGGGLFNIDQSSGIIVTAAALDREARIETNGAYVLTIGARERGSNVEFVYTEVSVILTDVNDQTPQFASDIYTAELSEDSQQGLPLSLIGAARPMVFDYDQGTNGTFRLSLEGAGGIFEISPPEGVNVAEFMIRVANSSALDYESVTEYNFTVVATEVASTRRSRAHVAVYMLDANDNSPLFELPKYSVDVSESATAGSAVAWIRASDVDTGRFGTAGIRFTSITGDIANSLSLDPMSGKITIATSNHGLDRETDSRHQLSVIAQDDLGRGNRNLVHLEIHLVDSNDNAPRCEQSDQRVTIAENAVTFPNHPLLVKASDDDQAGTVNSQLWFRVVGDAGGNFSIDASTGELRLRTGLDFEALDGEGDVRLLNVTVAVSDRGDPPLSATCVVRVLVRDVNDVAPRFDKFRYRKSLPEDSPGGTRVIQVSAIDGDGSIHNSLVVYRIQHGAQDKFVIDSDTGLISVSEGANLDPDLSQPRTTVYNLTVWALDGGVGGGQLSDTTSVIIVIQDVNNKPPMFVDPGLAYIAENARVGSVVKQLRAVDPDESPLLRYSIEHNLGEARNEQGALVRATEYNFTAAFQVHPITGLVRTARTLDRELVETVRMILKVEDLAAMNFRQSATVTLTIHLEDVNDHSPVFRQPYYRRAVMENASPGTAVASVVADDVDLNRTIFYSIHGPQPVTGLVFLDKETGEIVVSKKIDYELFHWLNFTVRATDSGVPSRTGHTEVYVQVLDENDNNPRFVDQETEVTVREDAPIGTPVVQVQAVDEDSGDYGKLTYRIDRRSSNGKFDIDPDSGEVSVLRELNREEQSTYSLIIQVWDNYQFGFTSGESRNAFKHITVTVADVNDETPRLQVTEDCVTVTEFHDPRDVITLVTAEDLDDPDSLNSRISFSILSGNHNGLFAVQAVDNNSANILATRRLVGDYGNYTLTVQAADGGYPSNKEERELYICVTDFNDHSPRFIQPTANVSIRIPENATVGSEVVYVLAEDEDIGINGAVRYRLRQDLLGNFRTFHVDEITGLLRLRQPLDRERQKVYELRVEAFDLGIPTSLSSDLDLTIFVSDVNDFQPQFLVDTFSVNFTEHRAAGSEKRRLVSTVDRDDPEDDRSKVLPVCYFIVGGNTGGIFTVDSLQHDIMTIKPLDREEQAIHELIIKASEDCQVKPNPVPFFLQDDDTLLKLIVFVDDINDNRPEFERRLFSGGVTTETDYGTEVMRVQAIDPDWGANARLQYAIQGAIKKTLSEGLDSIGDDPFVLDPETGVVILNFDPQRGMKGYFDFMVSVTDISGEGDTARVFIYLLREDQRIKFVLRMKPQEARKKSDVLRDALGGVSGSIVNIDEYKVHETAAGGVDRTKTDMYLHFVDKQDHSILDVHTALALLDRNVERLDPVFKELNVLSTEAAEDGTRRPGVRVAAIGWLIGICAVLLVLFAVVVFICANQRAKYKRMLRATTAAAFGSSATQGTRSTTVPNTNIHAVEGSNPVWMTGYGHDWYKPGLEVTSLPTSRDTEDGMNGDCQDSLDENAVNGGDSLIISNHQRLSTRTTHSSVNYNMCDDQNKPSRNGRSNGAVAAARPHYHQNILSCTARVAPIDKQLVETTEL